MATYTKFSPYANTGLYGSFLDTMVHRPITKLKNDKVFTIDRIYHNRPDLLASDLYGDARLWWVFAARNPNTIKDPLFDFAVGKVIYLPAKTTLVTDLGI